MKEKNENMKHSHQWGEDTFIYAGRSTREGPRASFRWVNVHMVFFGAVVPDANNDFFKDENSMDQGLNQDHNYKY